MQRHDEKRTMTRINITDNDQTNTTALVSPTARGCAECPSSDLCIHVMKTRGQPWARLIRLYDSTTRNLTPTQNNRLHPRDCMWGHGLVMMAITGSPNPFLKRSQTPSIYTKAYRKNRKLKKQCPAPPRIRQITRQSARSPS